METYEQLLNEFSNKQQDRKLQQKRQIEYQQLFNSIKSQNSKRKNIKNKLLLQKSSVKRQNKPIVINKHTTNTLTSPSLTLTLTKKQQNFQQQQAQQSRISTFTTKTTTTTTNLQPFINNFHQTKTMIQIQTHALKQQIDILIKTIGNLKQQKISAKQQLKVLTVKQQEMMILLNQTLGDIQARYVEIQQQKQKNQNQNNLHQHHITQLQYKLQQIKQQAINKTQQYKQLTQTTMQKSNSTFLGSILHLTKQRNRLKKMQKKLYTKSRVQEMLRAVFIVYRLAGINYGNIIEHLIKIAEGDDKKKRGGDNNNKKMFIRDDNNKGNGDNKMEQQQFYTDSITKKQLPIHELITKIKSQLLTTSQFKLISKQQIFNYYEIKHGILVSFVQSNNNKTINNNNNNNNNTTSNKTQQILFSIINHHQKLTSWFSRIQKRNQQLSQYHQSLIKIDDELSKQIKLIQSSSQLKSITYLQARQTQLSKLQQTLHQQCKVIFQFNITMYDLIKRFQSLNKFFDQLVKKGDRRGKYKKTYVQNDSDDKFMRDITKILFKSPESIVIGWNQVIKNNNEANMKFSNTNSSSFNNSNINMTNTNNFLLKPNNPSPRMSSSSSSSLMLPSSPTIQTFQPIQQNTLYFQTIMKNDLLRIYAQPQLYNRDESYIDNLQSTFTYVLNKQQEIIQKLADLLKGLLVFSKQGIQAVESKRQIQLPMMKISQQQPMKNNLFISDNNNNNLNNNNTNNINRRQSSSSTSPTQKLKLLLQQPDNPTNINNSKNQFRSFDKFFKKDQIKQQSTNNNNNINININFNITNKQDDNNNKSLNKNIRNQNKLSINDIKEDTNNNKNDKNNFCVQSNDYYRRDNFKIIQKLQKLNLKKRGLLPNVPFFNDTTLELQPLQTSQYQITKTLNRSQTEKQPLRSMRVTQQQRNTYNMYNTNNSTTNRTAQSPRLSYNTNNKLTESRHNMLSQRRQRDSTRKKNLKLLLSNISNIASQNQRYRIKKRINFSSNQTINMMSSTSASTSRINFHSQTK